MRGAQDGRLVRIDRDRRVGQFRANRADRGNDSRDFNRLVYGLMTRPRRLSADVQDVRTRAPLRDRTSGRLRHVLHAVAGKRVRRRVDDGHDVRARPPPKPRPSQKQRTSAYQTVVGDVPLAQPCDEECRAGYDDHVVELRPATRYRQGLDWIGDRPPPAPKRFCNRCEPRRRHRAATRNRKRRKRKSRRQRRKDFHDTPGVLRFPNGDHVVHSAIGKALAQ